MTLEPRGAQEFRRRAKGRPLLRYALLQVPGALAAGVVLFGLVRGGGLEPRTAWVLFALWVAKDAVMYRFVRRALSGGNERVGAQALLGLEGIADGPLTPRGRVRIRGESWGACSPPGTAIASGTRVRVLAVSGLELQVEPCEAPPDSRRAEPRS